MKKPHIAFIMIKKFGLYNLIIFTLPIHRYGFDVGFLFKPYLIVSIPFLLAYFLELPFSKRHKRKTIIDRSILFFLIAFLLFIFISMGINGYHTKSIRHFVLIVWGLVIVHVFFKKTNNLEKCQKCIDTFIFAGFLLALSGIYMYLSFLIHPERTPMFDSSVTGIFRNPYYDFGRLCGFENDPNAYAITLLPFIALSFSKFLWHKHQKLKHKKFPCIVSILLLINLVLTLSRSGYIACTIMFISIWMIILYKRRRLSTIVKSLIVLSLVILVFISFYYLDIFKGKLADDVNQLLFTKRMSIKEGRFSLWYADLEIFSSNIFWGVGQGLIRQEINNLIGRESQVHNAYFELFSEDGIFTGICFLILVFLILKKSFVLILNLTEDKFYYNLVGILSGFIGILVALMSISFLTSIIFWFQIGLLLICLNLSKSKGLSCKSSSLLQHYATVSQSEKLEKTNPKNL